MQSKMPTTVNNTSLKPDADAIHQIQQSNGEHSIGSILVKSGKLDAEKTEIILKRQALKNVPFGEAAIQLGFLKEDDIRFALARQYNYYYLLPGDVVGSDELVAAYQPFSTQAESLRTLRSQLSLRWFTTWPLRKTLSIVSSGSGEGKSYLAANLAVMFSQLGKRTLLIDADMRHGRQHDLFKIPNQIGLSTILSNRSDATSIQRVPAFMDLSVLTSGPTPPNPQELLGRKLFASLLAYASNEFDVVLVDTPPATKYADATTIAVMSGGALLVTRQDNTRLEDTRRLTDRLTELGVPMVGAVLNHF
jgi:chain length determinant protein tyrosine kinase EpsG